MQLVYVTSDRSFWELARLTLHGEGIETFESDVDPAITAVGSPFMQRDYRLYVLNNDDAAEAVELIRGLGGAVDTHRPLPRGWKIKLLCLLIPLLMVLVIVTSGR